ncbi:MAG: hypothetical protein KY475_23000, partial [Planctomycetes bacterium]|nr:hypothetical protein [Planctomycetota bacterium]
RAKEEGAVVIRKLIDRHEIVAQALAPLDGGAGPVGAELAADFLALGYCFLQVELLTRQMRYSSNLDQVHFENQTLAAAAAAMAGDEATARDKLAACFDLLAEERDHYYPVDAYVLDLTMLAPTTLGALLREQLSKGGRGNVLLSAELAEAMAAQEPESLAALRQSLAEFQTAVVGGEYRELRLPLLSCETILNQLRFGLLRYEELLGARPVVFGRRRFGLVPLLPQALNKLGFLGAVHATLEEGRFPEGTQAKTRWESTAGIAIDALARTPLNASQPGTYLRFAVKMGESMDMDHVATVSLAHWPGVTSPWYDDLQRIARHVNALGKPVTFDEYFRDTDPPSHLDRFDADQYRSPYLKEAIIKRRPDPISCVVRWWRRRAVAEAIQAIDTLTQLVSGASLESLDLPHSPGDALLEKIDVEGEELPESEDGAASANPLDEQVAAELPRAMQRFAAKFPRKEAIAEPGYLVVNPHSFVRRITLAAPELPNLPPEGRPIYAAGRDGPRKHVTVDAPSMGFVWVPTGRSGRDPKPLPVPLAEEGVLRNEFFEAIVNKDTGALSSIKEYEKRGNRLSQQLALRMPGRHPQPGGEYRGEDKSAVYSVMAADSVEVTVSNNVMGEIVSRGRLLTRKGEKLAGFTQRYRVLRGSRVIHVEVELDPQEECRSDPWNSYYCCRFAWANEAATAWRGINLGRQPANAKRLECPLYFEIEDGETRTTILTGGLPFHRRTGYRMLDSLLVVRGETERTFHMGIGVELKNSLHEALSFLAPETKLFQEAPPPANASGWLFHIDARTVAATHWAPVIEDGSAVGVRVRLLETAGRPARMKLTGFRPFAAAKQIDFLGQPLKECQVEEGVARLELAAHEWVELEARFGS